MTLYGCGSCSYTTAVRLDIKNHAAVLGHFGWLPVTPGCDYPGCEETAVSVGFYWTGLPRLRCGEHA